MSIPHSVLAGGWIPFVVVVVLTFLFAWVYIRLFQHHELSEVSSTLTSVFALFVTLLTSALVPVDVFLVSFMKDTNGAFKNWAVDNSSRTSIENTVTYTYYTLYGLVSVFIFLLLPFMYFYYEEKDDDDVNTKQRCCSALKFTAVFMLLAAVILTTGALVPLKKPYNVTSIDGKFEFLKEQLETYSNAEKAMSVLVGVLSMFGMLSLIMYTGYGMSALPLGMIRCGKRYKESNETENTRKLTKRERDDEKARMLRAKSRAGRNLTRFERNELRRIEQDENLRHRLERKKIKGESSCCGKILLMLKPFQVVFGIVFLSISLLIMISLTITSIDKAMNSLGARHGYALPQPKLPNPVNIIMVHAQKVFPLDYILFTGMTLFFIFASMNGIKRIGIWCCCIKMFKIRTRRTMPQALLFMVFIMMFMVLALNIVLFTITPQYVQYGNQKYAFKNGTQVVEVKSCTTNAPSGDCVMSSVATILNTLFYKAWFFGAFYYWSIWAFIATYMIAFIYNLYNICRTRREEEMLSSDDDSDSETERLVNA
ncbi:probable lysosomal cobalamin transporter [Hydractinia symbiolongicarpus]|uniref:probable lysosomal cobalamin transporter n=1 Tax=Hydractinia symbiolongicarpus TaxID=13093 RepID=UPI0025517695|nr:probable lysosomal cobalamin transporter [Hydractinia symbiolongicarpus]